MTQADTASPEITAINPKLITGSLRRWMLLTMGVLAVFLIWASLVPLATTIHTSGTLRSTAPAFQVQHPLGGRIAQVFVHPLDHVDEGALLIRFDVAREQGQLKELLVERTQIANDTEIIQSILTVLEAGRAEPIPARNPHSAALNRHLAEMAAARARLGALEDQAAFLSETLKVKQARLGSVESREARHKALLDKGLATSSDQAQLSETRLAMTADLRGDEGRLRQTRHEVETAQLELVLKDARFEESLRAVLAQNARRLPPLQREIIQLEDRIRQADVRSPSSGVVSTLEFDNARMFAPQGATLVTISQPLNAAEINFSLTPMVVDQVHPGMQGVLTIPSLPQRSMPKMRVEITSLSPVASHDETGAPVSFQGRARLIDGDQDKLSRLVDQGTRLVNDMPVSISFAGRELTFSDYLIKPFVDGLSRAMQD